MKGKLVLMVALLLIGWNTQAQNKKCSSTEKLQEFLAKDPTLQARLDVIELETQKWIKNNRNYKLNQYSPSLKTTQQLIMTSPYVCPWDNALYQTWAAPSAVGDSVADNCFYGGDYAKVTGMVAGNSYKISTCGSTAFDTEISVYKTGGVDSVAYNDDFCGSQSSIIFTPITSGDYDILVDKYGCDTASTCMPLTVKLVATPRAVITIPTVIHVVYNENILLQNVSDAQIYSQMDILNADFRRLNTDINTNAPPVFRGVSNDPLIEFCLAVRDPEGDPTTGITRTSTTHGAFTGTSGDDIHYDSLGGKDIWDRDLYMNIWVFDNGSAGGWATLPGAPADMDGQGLHYTSFGNIGTAAPPFPGGRTAVHEAAHWLNLEHVWGDTLCGDDLIYDTPEQSAENGDCPTFPHNPNSCTNTGPGGEMFMNFMDYIDDSCYAMFTYAQTERMDATLFGVRSSLQSSRGCLACPTITSSFTSSNTTICEGQSIDFTNASTGGTMYEWDEGTTTFSTSTTSATKVFATAGTYVISLWAYDQYEECADSTGVTITVNVCGAISDVLPDNFIKLYPNPGAQVFTIEMLVEDVQDVEISIVSVQGQEVYNEQLNNYSGLYQEQIDSRDFANGVYLVRVSLGKRVVTKKLTILK